MNTVSTKLESRTAELFGYSEAVLFGRARSALVTLFDVLGADSDWSFLIPANICPVVYTTALEAGINVQLAATDSQNGLPTDDTMAQAIRETVGPGIVMPSNLYGFTPYYPKTRDAASGLGWFLLENDTMATRAATGSMSRQNADALLISFGNDKTLEIGGGGGLLTNDPVFAGELRRRANTYPPLARTAVVLEDWLLESRRLIRRFPGPPSATENIVSELVEIERRELRYSFPTELAEPLEKALTQIHERIARRLERAEAWNHRLVSLNEFVKQPNLEQPVPWRIVRLLSSNRDTVVSALRADGIDAGTNYPPLSDLFPSKFPVNANPGGRQWADQVLNLWVSDRYDDDRIDGALEVIKRALP